MARITTDAHSRPGRSFLTQRRAVRLLVAFVAVVFVLAVFVPVLCSVSSLDYFEFWHRLAVITWGYATSPMGKIATGIALLLLGIAWRVHQRSKHGAVD